MAKCMKPTCQSGLPATYAFDIEGYEDEEVSYPPFEVRYCAPCVAFSVMQGYFSAYEVDSLRLL